MPRLTRIQELPRDRVALELDGHPWRVVPANAVARAGLWVGQRARPRARCGSSGGRSPRRWRSMSRDGRSPAGMQHARRSRRRLERRGVAPQMREEALDRLEELGAVDDARFAAESRAAARGDARRRRGDPRTISRRGVRSVVTRRDSRAADEASRAEAIVERDGRSPRTLRASRGGVLAEDVVRSSPSEPGAGSTPERAGHPAAARPASQGSAGPHAGQYREADGRATVSRPYARRRPRQLRPVRHDEPDQRSSCSRDERLVLRRAASASEEAPWTRSPAGRASSPKHARGHGVCRR